jgi:hypothetical protein
MCSRHRQSWLNIATTELLKLNLVKKVSGATVSHCHLSEYWRKQIFGRQTPDNLM